MRYSQTTRYKIMLEINNAVITSTSKQEFFEALSKELKKHFYYDRLSIFLYNQERQSLTCFTLADGIQPEGFAENERPLARGAVANMVIQSRKPVIIDDLPSYSGHASIGAMIRAGLKATMAFPLIVQNRILGTFHMSFKRTPSYISELAEILPDLSRQIAIAVANMISFSQLIVEKQNLEREKRYLMDSSED